MTVAVPPIIIVGEPPVNGTITGRNTARGVVPVALGWPPAFDARDLLTGEDFTWRVGRNYVKLGPGKAHVLKVQV